MNDKALAIIDEEKKQKSGLLNLSECELLDIPDDIAEMTWLTKVNLSKNKIAQIKNVKNLPAVISLDISLNKITEIENLEGLVNLQVLHLSSNQITSIKSIAHLINLKTLRLSNNKITEIKDLDPLVEPQTLRLRNNNISTIKSLATLIKLEELNIEGNQIEKIENTEKLAGLQTLNLSKNKITQIEALENAVNIVSLDISHNKISEIKNLDALINLKTLDLSVNQITEIKKMNSLVKLQFLNLMGNKIEEIKNIESLVDLHTIDFSRNEITEIKNLGTLQRLESINLSGNKITEIKNVDSLVMLKELNLGRNNIDEIKNLNRLFYLEHLDLSNTKIAALKNLNKLKNLQYLFLSNTQISDTHSLREIVESPQLKKIYLYNSIKLDTGIPLELFGSRASENCMEALRGYFDSLKKGIHQRKELPVILVGNSTAGKTSLRYFLERNIFPPPEDYSTHGIEPSIWQPDEESLENAGDWSQLKDLQIYFWDFGGQEYYHATHRLFFSKRAIYIVVWEQKTNKQRVEKIHIRIKKENGDIDATELPVELFPYSYWIQSIRNHATENTQTPIILLQNKIDEAGNEEKENPDPALLKKNNCSVLQLSVKNAYALNGEGKKDLNTDVFLRELFSNALKLTTTTMYGQHWEPIKKMLQDARKENVWSPEKLLAEMQVFDPALNANTMTSYALSLRALGLIIYEPQDSLLKDYIFINPGWVTEKIYSILDTSVIEKNGEFDKQHVIKKVDNEYADIFITLMKKFELVFENEELNQYIAPQYLPAILTDKRKKIELEQLFDIAQPDFVLQFNDFMPRHIMLRFLVAYGEKAIAKYYWKNGIAFTLNKHSALVIADYETKTFKIYVDESNAYTQRMIFDNLLQLSDNKSSLCIAYKNGDAVSFIEIEKAFKLKNQYVQAVNGKTIDTSVFTYLFEDIALFTPQSAKPIAQTKINLFLSYAHVDERIRKLFEDKYLKAIQNHYEDNLEVWSDIQLKPAASWDNQIKHEINNAHLIIFFLSNGFLASNYIKEVEISNALERYSQKKQIIVPVYIEEIPKKLLPFSDKQYLPSGKPLKEWKPQNKGWVKIQDGLISIIDDIRNGNTNDYYK